MKIKSETEFRQCQKEHEALVQKGSVVLGSMELLSSEEKERFIELVKMIHEWEAAYYPLPGCVSTLITDAIKDKMKADNLKQNEAAKVLGISESRISELLNGRRPLNLNIVKKLRDNLGISADFILDNL
ncbi:type II toxin-antitoxin system HigA family antitoxin [Bacteroides sp. 519]|uniref:helix-turn-helix domain-containing protein n=1 Tax=Bacteroides sp. 519 TaxID=2302937 RepID=UPI0013D2EAB4|nr:helix-turn-helix domain-containing protein [Bacteroides sp. 519]NDV60714.1 helix-turn-helix domain-containing protein [Bacteroides sp. 519]